MKPKSTGVKRTALANATGKSNGRSGRPSYPFYAICIRNDGNEASLRLGKAYRVIKPEKNDPPETLRVIDEEGEDYLYSSDWFVRLDLPRTARRALSAAIG